MAWTNVTMESVLDVPMNLHLKFHQNRVSNSPNEQPSLAVYKLRLATANSMATPFCNTLKVSLGNVQLRLTLRERTILSCLQCLEEA